jgi:hypothetical protein
MQNIRIAIKRYKFKPYMIFPRNNIKKKIREHNNEAATPAWWLPMTT